MGRIFAFLFCLDVVSASSVLRRSKRRRLTGAAEAGDSNVAGPSVPVVARRKRIPKVDNAVHCGSITMSSPEQDREQLWALCDADPRFDSKDFPEYNEHMLNHAVDVVSERTLPWKLLECKEDVLYDFKKCELAIGFWKQNPAEYRWKNNEHYDCDALTYSTLGKVLKQVMKAHQDDFNSITVDEVTTSYYERMLSSFISDVGDCDGFTEESRAKVRAEVSRQDVDVYTRITNIIYNLREGTKNGSVFKSLMNTCNVFFPGNYWQVFDAMMAIAYETVGPATVDDSTYWERRDRSLPPDMHDLLTCIALDAPADKFATLIDKIKQKYPHFVFPLPPAARAPAAQPVVMEEEEQEEEVPFPTNMILDESDGSEARAQQGEQVRPTIKQETDFIKQEVKMEEDEFDFPPNMILRDESSSFTQTDTACTPCNSWWTAFSNILTCCDAPRAQSPKSQKSNILASEAEQMTSESPTDQDESPAQDEEQYEIPAMYISIEESTDDDTAGAKPKFTLYLSPDQTPEETPELISCGEGMFTSELALPRSPSKDDLYGSRSSPLGRTTPDFSDDSEGFSKILSKERAVGMRAAEAYFIQRNVLSELQKVFVTIQLGDDEHTIAVYRQAIYTTKLCLHPQVGAHADFLRYKNKLGHDDLLSLGAMSPENHEYFFKIQAAKDRVLQAAEEEVTALELQNEQRELERVGRFSPHAFKEFHAPWDSDDEA